MDTKLKGDLAETRVLYELLRRRCTVLRPVGDRLPYDLVIDQGGRFIRIQVKSAWAAKSGPVVDTRRHQTNRQRYKHTRYRQDDFDFLVAWVPAEDVFFIMPMAAVQEYRSHIQLTGDKARSAPYRNAWSQLCGETELVHSVSGP